MLLGLSESHSTLLMRSAPPVDALVSAVTATYQSAASHSPVECWNDEEPRPRPNTIQPIPQMRTGIQPSDLLTILMCVIGMVKLAAYGALGRCVLLTTTTRSNTADSAEI
eukprot:1194253-Prorocentrum_minimum.AAC.3